MPWWYVGALAVSFVVALLLAPVANLVLTAPLWTGAVGIAVSGALFLLLRIRGVLRRRRARDA